MRLPPAPASLDVATTPVVSAHSASAVEGGVVAVAVAVGASVAALCRDTCCWKSCAWWRRLYARNEGLGTPNALIKPNPPWNEAFAICGCGRGRCVVAQQQARDR